MNAYKRLTEIFDHTARVYNQHRYTEEIYEVDTYGFLKDERLDFKDKTIIDVGSGLGECSNWFLKKGARKVVSLDPSHRSLVKAKEYIKENSEGSSALFVQSKAPDLPFRDGTFDMVFAHGMMSYVDDIETALKDLIRIAKTNGEIIVSFVKKNWVDQILELIRIPCSRIPVKFSKIISNILAVLFFPFAPIFIKKRPSLTKGYTLDRTFFEMFFVKSYKTEDKASIIQKTVEMGMKVSELEHRQRATNFVLLIQK